MVGPHTVPSSKSGTAPTGEGRLIGVRLQPDQLSSLDAWRAHQPGRLSRPEAMRRLFELGLSGR